MYVTPFQLPIGVVIVDSTTNETVAIAHDMRNRHPLQHATMVAIDLVARAQGGGAWKFNGLF